MNFDFRKFWTKKKIEKSFQPQKTNLHSSQEGFYRLRLLKKHLLVNSNAYRYNLFRFTNVLFFRLRYQVLSLGLILFFASLVVFTFLQYNQIFKNAKAALGPNNNTVSFGGGNISIDKVYVNNGSETPDISITQGEAITVRVKYNNTGNTSAKSVGIAENIPDGFEYVPNTLKNCYVDLACVGLNDNIVSNSWMALAPGAGYFGYANDNTTSTSNLELGKKHYLHLHQCTFSSNTSDKDLVSSFINTYSNSQMRAGTEVTNSPTSVLSCGSAPSSYSYQSGYSAVKSMNLSGVKYLNLTQCTNSINNNDYFNSYIDTFSNSGGKSPTNTSSNLPPLACGDVITGYTLDNTFSSVDSINLLENRFLHLHQCFYTAKSGRDLVSTLIDTYSSTFFKSGTTASNASSMNVSCGNSDSKHNATAGYRAVKTFDLIDTSRGYGYIEYQMISSTSTPTGITGTNTNMSGSMGSITTSSNQSITVNGYFNDTDSSNTNLVCNPQNVTINSVVNCTFILPNYELIPKISFQAFIEENENGSDCILDTVIINQVNCNDIPVLTGSGLKYIQFSIDGGNKINTKTQITVLDDIYLEKGNIPGKSTVTPSPISLGKKEITIYSPPNLKKSDNKTDLDSGTMCANTLILNQGKPITQESKLDKNAQCITSIEAGSINTLGSVSIQSSVSFGSQIYTTTATQAYVTADVVTEGLQLYYDFQNPATFDGKSQIVNDLSGNEHFAFLGKDEKTDESQDPKYNDKEPKSLIFDGKNQFLETSLNSDFSESITAEIWFKQNNEAKSDAKNIPKRLLTQFTSSQSMSRFGFGIQKNSIQIQSLEDTKDIADSGFIPGQDWQLAAFTFNPFKNTGAIFVNGAKQTDFTFKQIAPSDGNIKIGIFDETQAESSNGAFDGEIAALRIYSRDLSLEELKQNFDADKIYYGFTQNSLNISNSNTTIFTNVSVMPTSQTSTANIANFSITDRRQSTAPWSVSISATDFIGCTLKASNISINPGVLNLISGSSQFINLNGSIPIPNANTPITLISTSEYNGGGSYSLTPTLSLTIPPYTRTGTCSTSITISSS